MALGHLAFVKSLIGDYNTAKKIYGKLFDIAIKKGGKDNEAIMLHQLGMVERLNGNLGKALRLFEDELKVYQIYFIENNILYMQGICTYGGMSGNHGKAETLLKKSYHYANISKDPVYKGCACRGLGELYLHQRDHDKALSFFDEGISCFRDANDQVAIKEVHALKERLFS